MAQYPITVTLSQTNIGCNGYRTGSIVANVIGGVGPYQFKWSNNVSLTTNNSITDLSQGYYSVAIYDNNDSLVHADATIIEASPIRLGQFDAVTYPNGFNTTCATCNDGTVTVNVEGGMPPYTFTLSDGVSGNMGSNYIAEFEARKKIYVGKEANNQNIYAYAGQWDYLDNNDDFIVDNNSSCIIHSGEDITFLPGFEVAESSELHAYIEPFNCSNALYRLANSTTQDEDGNVESEIQSKMEINDLKIEDNNKVKIFPNPAYAQVTISLNEVEATSISILDVYGKELYMEQKQNSIGANKKTIDISQFPSGTYILRIVSNDEKIENEFIISR
jgi:hypothetical protein